MLLSTSLLLGLALVGFAFSESWYLSLALIVFVGFGQSGRQALGSTLLQFYCAPEYRGRVMSFMVLEFGIMGFATFFVALAAEVVGVQWAVGSLAMALVAFSLLFMALVPRLRRLD